MAIEAHHERLAVYIAPANPSQLNGAADIPFHHSSPINQVFFVGAKVASHDGRTEESHISIKKWLPGLMITDQG